MGFYAYIEASLPRKPNDTARLISPTISTSQCLNFWYHMYGSHVSKLNVYVKSPSASYGVPVWSKYGSHGNTWKAAHVYMNAKGSYVVSYRLDSKEKERTFVTFAWDCFEQCILKSLLYMFQDSNLIVEKYNLLIEIIFIKND